MNGLIESTSEPCKVTVDGVSKEVDLSKGNGKAVVNFRE